MEVRKQYIDAVNKNANNAPQFFTELERICKNLGLQLDWVASVMWIETGKIFSPSIKNPTSTASGLIQFMEATAKELGTTTLALRQMSNIQQLKYVELYFKKRISAFGQPKDFFDTYCLVFYPVWIKKPDTDLMSIPTGNANISIDKVFGNKDGRVSKAEFRKFALSKLPNSSILEVVAEKKHTFCPYCSGSLDIAITKA